MTNDNTLRSFAFLLLSCALASSASATPQLSTAFSDHMVLQRDNPIRVWGTADRGEKLTVRFDGESVTTNADKKTGRWLVTLGARPASSVPKKLVVESGSDYGSTTVDDVLVGDVWLVTGQSNMEMTFRWGVVDGDLVQANASRYPLIRAMKSNWTYRTAPQAEPNLRYRWYLPAQANIGETSAIGWMFATEVFDRVKVPIGLVDLSYSGSKIEPFIPIEGFRTEPSLAPFVSFFDAATTNTTVAEWRAHTRNMTMHYNGMVAPFVNLSAKGWIWYQGCSNADDAPGMYAAKMRALAKGWRTVFGQDLPFCFAQISAFHEPGGCPAAGDGYSEIRLEQLEALKEIPDCGMVVTMDVGEGGNIHPKCKKPVADRFARWALNRVYGCGDVAYSGPVYREARVEGDTVRIFFDFAEGGLVSATQDVSDNAPPTPNGGPLRMFAVAGADGIWYDACARIDGETVVVSAPEVKEPKAVRYACDTNPGYTNLLYNAALLPASPFSTNGREKLKNPATDWMPGKVGLFTHCLLKSNDFARVSSLDVEGLARQIIAAKPDYYVITLGQNTGYYCAPNAVYERQAGYAPGERCSPRDIPAELFGLLRAAGIRVGLYLPCQPATKDEQAAVRMGFAKELNKGNRNFTPEGVASWNNVIREWATRYGRDVSLWWFDGAYRHLGFRNEIGVTYARTVKSVNPDAVVAFNRDVGLAGYVQADDYTAGELNEPFEVSCGGRWVDGFQWHAFSFMGKTWCERDMRFTERQWLDWALPNLKAGGAIMLDLGLDLTTFRLDDVQLKAFSALTARSGEKSGL